MNRYRAELFTNQFEPLGAASAAVEAIDIDYLAPQTFEITIAKKIAGIKQLYPIRIMDGNSTVFDGLVYGWDYSTETPVITVAPWRILFDCMYQNLTLSTATIEQAIQTFFENVYATMPSALIERVQFDTQSRTPETLLADHTSVNMLELTNEALLAYGIAVNMRPIYALGKLSVEITKQTDPLIIEGDLRNVIAKDVQIDGAGLRYTWLTAYKIDQSGRAQFFSKWYLKNDGTVAKSTEAIVQPDAVQPPVLEVVEITDDQFTEGAMGTLARTHLIPQTENNTIALTVRGDDKLITLDQYDIGARREIRIGGETYTGRMTGIVKKGETKMIIFGAVRRQLTKKLQLRRYREGKI